MIEHVIQADGRYHVILHAGGPDPRLYRNRVRLLIAPAGGAPGWIWQGSLEKDDLLELDGDAPLSLQVMIIDQGEGRAHQIHSQASRQEGGAEGQDDAHSRDHELREPVVQPDLKPAV